MSWVAPPCPTVWAQGAWQPPQTCPGLQRHTLWVWGVRVSPGSPHPQYSVSESCPLGRGGPTGDTALSHTGRVWCPEPPMALWTRLRRSDGPLHAITWAGGTSPLLSIFRIAGSGEKMYFWSLICFSFRIYFFFPPPYFKWAKAPRVLTRLWRTEPQSSSLVTLLAAVCSRVSPCPSQVPTVSVMVGTVRRSSGPSSAAAGVRDTPSPSPSLISGGFPKGPAVGSVPWTREVHPGAVAEFRHSPVSASMGSGSWAPELLHATI